MGQICAVGSNQPGPYDDPQYEVPNAWPLATALAPEYGGYVDYYIVCSYLISG